MSRTQSVVEILKGLTAEKARKGEQMAFRLILNAPNPFLTEDGASENWDPYSGSVVLLQPSALAIEFQELEITIGKDGFKHPRGRQLAAYLRLDQLAATGWAKQPPPPHPPYPDHIFS